MDYKFLTLFQYLGKAAGEQLGADVWSAAYKGNVPICKVSIENKTYKGLVNSYPIDFLEDFFTHNENTFSEKMKDENILEFLMDDCEVNMSKNFSKSLLGLILDSTRKVNINVNNKKSAVISLSGGMDSGTLLLKCVLNFEKVIAVSFDYGQKHKLELQKARNLVNYLNSSLEGYGCSLIEHHVIKLDGLSSLLSSSLVIGGSEVPEGHYEDENMKETVVPNRNKIFSSIIQSIALSEFKRTGNEVSIAMGIHSGDHAIYPDCTPSFRDADFEAFKKGNWNSENVKLFTPYLNTDKSGILKDGFLMLTNIGLDYKDFYFETMTSYKPVRLGDSDVYVSDYKSSSSVERVEAFLSVGLEDPIPYADEQGIVSWGDVVGHVVSVLNK